MRKTHRIYLDSGQVIKVRCKSLVITRSTVTGECTKWTITGMARWNRGPYHLNPRSIVAVTVR